MPAQKYEYLRERQAKQAATSITNVSHCRSPPQRGAKQNSYECASMFFKFRSKKEHMLARRSKIIRHTSWMAKETIIRRQFNKLNSNGCSYLCPFFLRQPWGAEKRRECSRFPMLSCFREVHWLFYRSRRAKYFFRSKLTQADSRLTDDIPMRVTGQYCHGKDGVNLWHGVWHNSPGARRFQVTISRVRAKKGTNLIKRSYLNNRGVFFFFDFIILCHLMVDSPK